MRKIIIELPKKEDEKTSQNQKEQKQNFFGLLINLVLITLLVISFFALTSAKIDSETILEDTNRTITEKMPVILTEKYNETVTEVILIDYTKKRSCTNDLELPARYNYTMVVKHWFNDTKKINTCIADVTNLEQEKANFTFYVEVTRSDGVWTNYLDQTKQILPQKDEIFVWNYQTDADKSAVCNLKVTKIDNVRRCEIIPIDVYNQKEETKIVEKQRNKTLYVDVKKTLTEVSAKEKIIYVNRLFGYRQPFYFGY